MRPLLPSDPDRIGRYELEGILGSGGMGTVYFGRSPGGRPAAIKVINPAYLTHHEALARFRREAETLQALRSAYTAALIDSSLSSAPYWMATEYIPGPTLSAAVKKEGAFPAEACIRLLAAMAEGLSDIHALGICHRDLKPQNVILSSTGPQLIDFGIARGVEQSGLTMTGITMGTPGYIAPELLDSDDLTPAVDVFALGATVAYAATGRRPYGEGTLESIYLRLMHEEIDLANVDPGLADLIRWCVAKDRTARPSPDQIIERCRGWRQANGPTVLMSRSQLFPGGAAPAAAGTEIPSPPIDPLTPPPVPGGPRAGSAPGSFSRSGLASLAGMPGGPGSAAGAAPSRSAAPAGSASVWPAASAGPAQAGSAPAGSAPGWPAASAGPAAAGSASGRAGASAGPVPGSASPWPGAGGQPPISPEAAWQQANQNPFPEPLAPGRRRLLIVLTAVVVLLLLVVAILIGNRLRDAKASVGSAALVSEAASPVASAYFGTPMASASLVPSSGPASVVSRTPKRTAKASPRAGTVSRATEGAVAAVTATTVAPVTTPTSADGRCIQMPSNDANGVQVSAAACTGADAQQWDFTAAGVLMFTGSDGTTHCLDLGANGGADLRYRVQLWACYSNKAQTWVPQSSGALFNAYSGRCLTILPSGSGGPALGIETCAATTNQRWTLPS